MPGSRTTASSAGSDRGCGPDRCLACLLAAESGMAVFEALESDRTEVAVVSD